MADHDSMVAGTTNSRICSVCKQEKPATSDHFHAYKRAPDGCRAVCRICRAADHAANRDVRLAQRRDHYRRNSERLIQVAKAYYVENADAQRAVALKRHYKNREARLEQMRTYRAANVESLNGRRRPKAQAKFRDVYGVDLAFTFKHRLRALVRATLTKGRQGRRMHELLGYDAETLRSHLERQFTAGMSWERFMAGEIHIDHIIPAASFRIDSADSAEFSACWALSNLRPMWAKENLSKGDKHLTLL